MTKTVLVLAGVAIAAVLLGSVLTVGMFTPKAEASHQALNLCGFDPTNPDAGGIAQHWDKIIFQIVRDPSGTINSNYLKTPLDIKVVDDPGTVKNLVKEVRNFLDDHGVGGLPPGSADIVQKLKIDIIDVEYAIICIFP